MDIGSHIIADLEEVPPDTMGQVFDRLAHAPLISMDLAARLKKAVGFRNVVIHGYEAIDWVIVYNIFTERLDDFVAFAQVIANQVEK